MSCLGYNTHGENIYKCVDKNTKQAHNQILFKKKAYNQSNNMYVDRV